MNGKKQKNLAIAENASIIIGNSRKHIVPIAQTTNMKKIFSATVLSGLHIPRPINKYPAARDMMDK